MNFSNLEYFVTVAEELNITKAAERLYISQQSLSNQIIKLENELNVKLFSRTPSLSLTYAGASLLKHARSILDLHNQMLCEIEDIKENKRGFIKIGVSHTRGRVLLPDILPSFQAKYPLVEVNLVEGNTETLENKLRHGEIDVVLSFTPRIQDGIESIKLVTDRLLLVVHRKFMYELFGDKTDYMRGKFSQSVDISAFKDCPFLLLTKGNRIRTLVDNFISKNKIAPNIILETENTETAFALALKGMGIAVYPEMFLSSAAVYDEVDFFPITSEETLATLAVSYAQDRYISKAVQDFIDIAVNFWQNKTKVNK
ncbi:MAG: LysR family transcriptional regulator [Clostridiales bacterium]|nr:LysR family transcriptional regulator [Clostridiales bacterium]